MMEKIILIGGGGHCISVIDALQCQKSYNIAGIIDLEHNVGKEISGIKIIATDKELSKLYNLGIHHAFITVGSISPNAKRINLFNTLKAIGYSMPVIIDESAIVSKKSVIGEGTFIGKGVIINAESKIGLNCIINTGAIIEHHCIINNYTHIAPGCVLSGNVTVGENTHVGTNSTIIQNISIGNNVLIGAGSVVVKNIMDNCKAYGNPCKVVSAYE